MLIDYKVFKQANLSGQIHKLVNLSELAGDLYIGASYLAINLYFI